MDDFVHALGYRSSEKLSFFCGIIMYLRIILDFFVNNSFPSRAPPLHSHFVDVHLKNHTFFFVKLADKYSSFKTHRPADELDAEPVHFEIIRNSSSSLSRSNRRNDVILKHFYAL